MAYCKAIFVKPNKVPFRKQANEDEKENRDAQDNNRREDKRAIFVANWDNDCQTKNHEALKKQDTKHYQAPGPANRENQFGQLWHGIPR